MPCIPTRNLLGACLAILLSAGGARALAANPYEDLFGPAKGKAWSDPDGRFAVELPAGWEARASGDRVELLREHPDSGYVARVTVRVRALPPGVSTRHFALRLRDEVRAGAPGVRLLGEERRVVGGAEAQVLSYTYQERGNASLVNEATLVTLVQGERGYSITLELAAGTREVFATDFDKLLASFSPAGAGGDAPRRPGERRRLKAGEMIDPDGLQY